MQRWIRSPWLWIALGSALHLPALWVGFLADDHVHQLALARGGTATFDLFDFGTASGAPGFGGLPWWTSADWSVRFLRPVTSLSLALDRALFGRHAWAHHLDQWLMFVGLLALCWRFFGQLGLSALARCVAVLLLAADESTVVPAGWLANRNSLLEAIFFVGALSLALDGRRALAFGLALLTLLSKESGIVCLLLLPLWTRAPQARPRRGDLGLGGLAALLYLFVFHRLGRGASSRFYPEPWDAPLDTLARAPGFLAQALTALWTPFSPDLGFYQPSLLPALTALAALGAALISWLLWKQRHALGPRARLLALSAGLCLAPQIAAPASNRLLLLPAVFFAPLLAEAALAAGRWGQLVLISALPVSALSTFVQLGLLVHFGAQSRSFIQGVAALAREHEAHEVLLLSVPNPLVGLSPGSQLLEAGVAGVDARVLQLGARGLELTGLEGGGLRVRSLGSPLASAPMEQVFRSGPSSFRPGPLGRSGSLDVRVEAIEGVPGPARDGVRTLSLWPSGPLPLLIESTPQGPRERAWPAPGEVRVLPEGRVPWPFAP